MVTSAVRLKSTNSFSVVGMTLLALLLMTLGEKEKARCTDGCICMYLLGLPFHVLEPGVMKFAVG